MASNTFPKIIHWHICGKCQLHCRFCYAILDSPALNTNECKDVIKKIKESEIEMVVFTGGEPLLRNDIVELISLCKKQGLSTTVDTNAILLTKELISKLSRLLDRVGIPLDGPPQIHDLLRGKSGHFQEVVNALRLLQDTKMKIKINTVLCKQNLSKLGEIGKILKPFKISLWSLYQFFPLGKSYTNRKEFEITKKDFFRETNKVKKNYPQLPIEVVPYSLREGSYFAISPSGYIYTTPIKEGKSHIKLGSVLRDNLLELWNSKLINREKSKERYSTWFREN